MKKYWKYFKYVLEHKKNVFIECWKVKGMFWHGITHDLSKFSPKEFKPYAIKFYGEKNCKRCSKYMCCDYNQIGLGSGNWAKECADYNYEDFDKAWKHHYSNNKHHWDYWIGKDMPYKYRMQMICDWKAMGRKFGDTAEEYYLNNYFKFNMTYNTRMMVEHDLELNFSHYHNYGHTMEDFANMYEEDLYNSYFGWIKEKYKIDTYKFLNKEQIK